MDVNALKGRIAEAFVENIFRQAGYKVSRLGRESQVQHLLKVGTDEFLPDFLVWKPIEKASSGRPLHRLLTVEVKYRSNIGEFLRRSGGELFSQIVEQWPELYVVFVTDNPHERRSCFQVVDLQQYTPDTPLTTMDLHEAGDLGIYKSAVEEYEGLVKQVFSLLGQQVRVDNALRKPEVRIPSPKTASVGYHEPREFSA